MRSVKTATVDVIRRLEESLAFQEIRRMADGFCTRWYLVGGRAYRTLAEELHGEKCGANEADWDFLCFDTTIQPIQFDGWKKTRGPGSISTGKEDDDQLISSYGFSTRRMTSLYGRNKTLAQRALERRKRSSRFEGGKFNQKVDFIAIEDVKEQGTLEDYFNVVPLDIQAIALDMRQKKILGEQGISAVCRKSMRLKNRACLENEGRDPDLYIEAKKSSFEPMKMQITYNTKHNCFCYPDDIKMLFAKGCHCGGI